MEAHSRQVNETTQADQITFFVLDLTDLGSANYFETIHADDDTEYELSMTDIFTIAGSDLGTDEWAVLGYLRTECNAANGDFGVQVLAANDTSTSAVRTFQQVEPEDVLEDILTGFALRHKASSGTPNLQVQAFEEASGNNHRNGGGYAIALKTAAFDGFAFDYEAGATTIDTTERTFATITSYSPPTTADHLIFGMWNQVLTTATRFTQIHVEDDDVEMRVGDQPLIQKVNSDVNNRPQSMIFHMDNILSSDTSTYTLRGAADNTDETVEHRWLMILSLEKASAGPSPIDLTHLSSTTFPTPTIASSSFQMTTLQSTVFFSPQLDGEIVLGHLANTTIFSPTLTSTIDLAHLANTTFFSPQLDGNIDLALLSSTTFPTPHVLSVLDMALLSGTTFFALNLDGNIDLALLSSTVFPVIQLDGEILLTHLANTTFPTFFVDGNIDLAHLANTTIFSPQLDGEILLTTLSGTVFPLITVVSGAGPEPLDMDLLSSTVLSSIFIDGNIDLTHLANTTIFSPQLDGTIDLAHLAGTVIPSITVGEANIDLTHLANTTLFSMQVDGNIDLAHLNNTVIFSTNVAGSSIDLALLSSTTIFAITVVDPAAVAVGIQLPMRGVDR